MNPIQTSIELQQLEFSIHLGWSESERMQKQTVSLDITLHFAKPPEACISDELTDTFDYGTLSNSLTEHFSIREYRLLEHLGHDIYQFIKALAPKNMAVLIRISKKPPVANLSRASFTMGETTL